MLRPSDPLDGATPSGASSIAEALLVRARLTAPVMPRWFLYLTDIPRAVVEYGQLLAVLEPA